MVCKTVATGRRPPRARALIVLAGMALGGWSSAATADPLRLRADAFAQTQAPVGLLILQGSDKANPWFDAEGLLWTGARPYAGADATGDVLVMALRLRAPRGIGELRAGRFLFSYGAIRPVHVDGASAVARAPWGTTLEAFGGAPVVPSFGARAYDWIAGGRLAQTVTSRVTGGVSYVQRRVHGDVANEEVGADLAAMPAAWLDLAMRAAYDMTSPGLPDASVSAAMRSSEWRLELFASQRTPSRLLPATSLFSVLGDVPSSMVGTTVRWHAAPRLDWLASGAMQTMAGRAGGNAWTRALLRLDDEGDGSVGLELRRQDAGGAGSARWTGARAILASPVGAHLRASSEIEIVFPDEPRGRGSAWPWGLLALTWRSLTGWEVAAAVESASTPEHRYEVNGLFRVSCALGGP